MSTLRDILHKNSRDAFGKFPDDDKPDNGNSSQGNADDQPEDIVENNPEKTFDESVELMTYYLAQYEGFSATAYHGKLDPPGVYTIGFGNTIHPDGRKVKLGDKLTSAEQAVTYTKAHIMQKIWPQLQEHFHVEKMTPQQMVAVVDLMYNAGQYLFSPTENKKIKDPHARKRDLEKRTALKEVINDFMDNPSDENRLKLVSLWSDLRIPSAAHKVRRAQEAMIFTGEITIGMGENLENAPNYLDLSQLPIGALNLGSFSDRKKYLENMTGYDGYGYHPEVGDSIPDIYKVNGVNFQKKIETSFKRLPNMTSHGRTGGR